MISVLMCTYNRERYLKQAIDSVLNQTYTDLEFIIVDDGSTDTTEDIISSYDDKRIKYYKLDRNSYYCYAANYGLKFCQGEYIAFMNSDDIWMPDKLEKQVGFLEAHTDCLACFTAVTLIDADNQDITDKCPEMRDLFQRQYTSQKECMQTLLTYKNTLCHPSALVRKEVMDTVGGFNLMFCQLADYDLWVRIVTEGPIHVMEERLIKFRWDMKKKDQISIATRENAIRAFNEQMIIRRHLVERLSDEKFIQFFGEQFKNKESKSHIELAFERGFLLRECITEMPEQNVLCMEKLEQVMREADAMQVLREHFGMDIFELYAWNKSHMYQSPWLLEDNTELQLTINHQKNLMEQMKQNQEELQQQIDIYKNSTSWKITEPLRKVMRILKK